jgi:exodeoxyribonuclease-1
LTHEERARWDDYRRLRLFAEPVPGGKANESSLRGFRAELAQLRQSNAGDGARLVLLDQIDAWSRELEASLQ